MDDTEADGFSRRRLLGLPVGMEKREAAAKASAEAFPRELRDRGVARNYLFRVIFPPSRRWVYKPVAKAGTSSLLKVLFALEFGVPFTFETTPLDDINPAHSAHMLASTRIFGRALEYGFSLPELQDARQFGPRVTLVRDPHVRAVSAFRYLCRTHALKSRWFEADRIRLMATCGFNWETHPGTAHGFRLFLEYARAEIETVGVDNVNEHWRPQIDCLKPDAFRPDLTGKLEDFPAFVRDLCAHLSLPAPQDLPHDNRREARDDIADAAAKRLCESIYRADFERFGY